MLARSIGMDIRAPQIEHDALLIAGWTVQSVLYSSRLTEEQRAQAQALHDTLHRKTLIGLDDFNASAWLGNDGILAKWAASKWRRHTGMGGQIKVTAWGIAGQLGCVLMRGDETVVVRSHDRPGSPAGYVESTAIPRVAAEIIWQAAYAGRALAASLEPCVMDAE